MTIVDTKCPRCATNRTVQWAQWGAFCFNCRLHWDRSTWGSPAIDAGLADRTMPYAFQPAELARLYRYRAAIQGGVYSDWPAAHGNSASSRRL